MKTISRMLQDEVFESESENGSKTTIDTRKIELRKSHSPMETVLSALATCSGVEVVMMIKKRKKTIINFEIETTGTRRDEAPRYYTKINCHFRLTSPDATEDELQKVAALALEKYCSVAASLKSEITLTCEVVRL